MSVLSRFKVDLSRIFSSFYACLSLPFLLPSSLFLFLPSFLSFDKRTGSLYIAQTGLESVDSLSASVLELQVEQSRPGLHAV